MSSGCVKVSEAAFEIERMLRERLDAGRVFDAHELKIIAACLHLMGDVSRQMEGNLSAYREGARVARTMRAIAIAEAVVVPDSNVVLFPVVRRETFGGAA